MAKYYLYYAGLDDPSPVGREQIGLATSDDLIHWRRANGGPIIPAGSAGESDALQTSNPCVLQVPEGFKMWYQGKSKEGNLSICEADSLDGLTWQAREKPVFTISSDEPVTKRAGFQHPHVIFDASTRKYHMWFVRQYENMSVIAHAESPDAETWETSGDTFLRPSEEWEGTLLYYPFVNKMKSGLYELWYTGRSKGGTWRIGRANSRDGIHWEKDQINPIIPAQLLPPLIRSALNSALPTRAGFLCALNGSASPNLITTEEGAYMLTHDVGIKGRLSINLYEESFGAWRRKQSDLLRVGAKTWDRYFQADPFVLRVES